jgi:methylenetetrahydrofolate dehydrogenase (NADP+)/methenyltetrahydrofolate cyclohydrolase
MTRILDGRALAARRAPLIARRAAAVTAQRGRAPTLLLMAFRDADGRVPHVAGKLRACEAVDLDAVPLVIDSTDDTRAALRALHAAVAEHSPDAVFVQVPCPAAIDGAALEAAIPPDSDVDVMSPPRFAQYMRDATQQPPVTVTAALLLLDDAGIDVAGMHGVVIADDAPFTAMLGEAFERRGARIARVDPAADAAATAGRADLVIVAAARPGLLAARAIAQGSVAIDVGYFNPGGRGDIDTASGIDHLRAIIPVPGGIGPMTVSALLERVVDFAERR